MVALASLMMCACSLDEYPYGFYSENNFYKTDADALAAINYVYDAINYIEYSRAIVFLGDMNTDVMYPKGDAKTSTKELDGWKSATFKTNTTLFNFYKYSYITINRANSVIDNVGAMKDLDKATKDQYVGEAYFMRAYSYFNLARNFGRVPMHLTTVRKLEDATVGAAKSLDEVWKQIFDDLDEAIKLTKVYPTPVTGRTDKVAAYALAAISSFFRDSGWMNSGCVSMCSISRSAYLLILKKYASSLAGCTSMPQSGHFPSTIWEGV